MLSQVDFSLLLSTALALAWVRGAAREEGLGEEGSAQRLPWLILMTLRSAEQILPSVLVLLAASSPLAALWSGFSFGLYVEGGDWLGDEVGFLRRWTILLAVIMWRAEKIETLFQRVKRSAGIVKANGLGHCLKNGFSDPWNWMWPGSWGAFRRFALVAVSTLGYNSFVSKAFPAVVFDELLWWAFCKLQDIFSRKVAELPMSVSLVLLPLLDTLHMIPALVKVVLLAIMEYPLHDSYPLLLPICAFAWTGHNCHMVYTTVLVDLPEHVQQLWAARNIR
eukprot:TRINITY_DN36236_c0_g1_i2.p1 TRINITY_DN36236_c0_g1~~TRINITY_DN36236_c0_g1_i2.p1  ORF type:complete len:279 (-),score=43.59 TRINITY_DN36236_c0_g1_i2:44-880(-)